MKCVITKMYVTARGGRGVCYRFGSKKGATFLPASLQGMQEVRAWLSRSLGHPVAPAHEVLSRIDASWLARLVGKTHITSQTKMLMLTRAHFSSLSCAGGVLVATVSSGSGSGKSWKVTLDPARKRAACSCPHATHNPGVVCKHQGALARILLTHPDVSGRYPPSTAHLPCATAMTRALSVGWAYITEQRDGAVRLQGRDGARWVGVGELLLCELQEHDGGLGAWVGVPPGHPLEQVGLLQAAPQAHRLAA